MVEEVALIGVAAGKEEAFEAAVATAASDVFPRSSGFISLSLARCVERPNTYALKILWETVEDHTEGFVKSELFDEWRGLVEGILEGVPVVEHWRPVDLG